MTARAGECLSRLAVDRWLNGELGDDAAAHVAGCRRCAALVAEHRRERAAFAVPLRARRRWRWSAWGAVAAAAAALAVWLAVPRDDATRSKGHPAIGFYVKHGDSVRKGGGGEVVFPGDALNFTASTDEPRQLAIISVDGASQVTAYYPGGPVTAPLPAGHDQVLPLSVVLDGVLGRERLYGIFCDRPIAIAPLLAAIGRGDAPPVGCSADLVTIEKRAP